MSVISTLRGSAIAAAVLLASPSAAAIQLEFSDFYLVTASDFESFEPGLGSVNRTFSFSDIGGCEGFDEEGIPCGGFESGRVMFTFTDDSFTYAADISQWQYNAGQSPDTIVELYGTFRSDRRPTTLINETRILNIGNCPGACPVGFSSSLDSFEDIDGSWLTSFSVVTTASVSDADLSLLHDFSLLITEVPEPGTWLLMISGFGLVGAAARTRRHHRAAAPA